MTTYQAKFSISVQQEDLPITGNVLASGNKQLDSEAEDEIFRKLNSGHLWAWCSVCVTAEFRGLTGTAYLGGCSYEDEEDFKSGIYYEEMKQEALNELNGLIKNVQGCEVTL